VHWFRRHWVLSAAGVAVLLVAVLVVWTAVTIEQPGPASVDEALERFHDDGGDDGTAGGRRPPAGVYRYVGEGAEHLSFPPLDQADGAEMPGTVTHRDDGCWTFRIDYNAGHWQEWRWCAEGDEVVERGGRTGQSWDLGVTDASNVSSFRCDPPNPVLGPSVTAEGVEHRCRGTNTAIAGETTSAGSWRLVGEERLSVDGAEVEVVHLRGERDVTGGQEGTESTEAWFRADGLLVRYEREIEVATDSPVGDITYTESGWFELAGLTPQQ